MRKREKGVLVFFFSLLLSDYNISATTTTPSVVHSLVLLFSTDIYKRKYKWFQMDETDKDIIVVIVPFVYVTVEESSSLKV